MSNIFTHHKVVLPWAMDLIGVFTGLMFPLVLVKLIKGHFTHFRLGCFFFSLPFLLNQSFSVSVPLSLHLESIYKKSVGCCACFLLSRSQRLRVQSFLSQKRQMLQILWENERLSQGERDGTKGGGREDKLGGRRGPLRWYFRSRSGIKTGLCGPPMAISGFHCGVGYMDGPEVF